MGYKSLTIIQTIFIILLGFSILDYGVLFIQTTEDPFGDNQGLVFNYQLFYPDGIIGGIFEDLDELWNINAFWGYLLLVIAILQLLKAKSANI